MSDELKASAIVAHVGGGIEIVERAVRAPGADEAVVRVAYGGICGSDLHYRRHGAVGQSVIRDPLVLGHEIVGTVLHAATDGSGPAAGMAVAVHPGTPAAGGGEPYPIERSNLSPGGSYLGSAAHFPHTDGGFATIITLPARMLRTIPDGVSLRSAVLAEPAAVALHAVHRAGDLTGRSVAVIGCGPIGALITAMASRAGAADIVAVDLGPRAVDVARDVGATRGQVAPDEAELAALHAEVVFESSGTVPGLSSAIRASRRGGRVVMVGLLPPGAQPVPIAAAISAEIDLLGSFRFIDEIDEVLEAIADGSLDAERILTHEFPYEQAEEAFAVASDAVVSTKVLLRF